MIDFVNDRDRLIQATSPRYSVNIAEKAILVSLSAPVFAVNNAGTVATPTAITVTVDLLNIVGPITFSVSAGATISVAGNVATLQFANMSVNTVFITAKAVDTETGVEFLRSSVISKVFDGATGATNYTWVKYADNASGGGLSDSPTGKAYIGLAYNKPTAVESTVPGDYAWSLIKGTDGVPGTPGADGVTLYTWIKYSDLPDGTGLYDVPTASTMYLGLATNKTTATESTVKTDYAWSKFKGDQGVPGVDAPPRYTWVKYADNASGGGLSDNPTGKTYIGLAYNKLTATESTTPSDYEWALIKGTDGVPGTPGADGQTFYTWIKYSDVADGTGLYDIPTANTMYIGLSTNRTSATESTVKTDYVWSKFKGDQGVPGTDAPPRYTWVKYGDSSIGAGLSDSPAGKTYIGLAYNKLTAVESTVASDYEWALIKGADGIPGTPGADGVTLYTWVKYSDFPDGTGLYDIPTATTLYLGLAVNKTSSTESTNKSDYVWSKFKGDQGVPGSTGPNGQRGTKILAVSGYSTWSDASAVAELAAAGFGAPINRDMVTLYGPLASAPTFTMTKFYDNGTWVVQGTYIDGGLLVHGTVAAQAISTDRLSAISANLGNVTAGDIYGATIHGGAGYPTSSYAWPNGTGDGKGFHLSGAGLLMGDYNGGAPGAQYFSVTPTGTIEAPGFRIAGGKAYFSGNVVTGTGSAFRIEMGPDDPVYAMWAGTGAKNDTNAIFYLKKSGSGYFGGSLSAGTLKTAVTNPTFGAAESVITGPFGSNGGAITVVGSINMYSQQTSYNYNFSAGTGTTGCTFTLYRKVGSDAEAVAFTFYLAGNQSYDNYTSPDDLSSGTITLDGSFTFLDPVQSTQPRTYRLTTAITYQDFTLTKKIGAPPVADIGGSFDQRLTIVTTE